MAIQLNINDAALVVFTDKLERLNRSALPVVVRQTLNSAAFHLKQTALIKTTDKTFIKRKPSFWRAFSRVSTARGFNIQMMRSMVGFTGNDQAVDDLVQQERGGTIESRSFIAMDSARVSKSERRPVRANARLRNIHIVDARKGPGTSTKAKFVRAVHKAGRGGFVLAEYKDKTILWRVNSTRRTKDGSFKLTAIYSYEAGRDVQVKPTGFMTRSAQSTRQQIPGFFKQHAQRQFQKAMR